MQGLGTSSYGLEPTQDSAWRAQDPQQPQHGQAQNGGNTGFSSAFLDDPLQQLLAEDDDEQASKRQRYGEAEPAQQDPARQYAPMQAVPSYVPYSSLPPGAGATSTGEYVFARPGGMQAMRQGMVNPMQQQVGPSPMLGGPQMTPAAHHNVAHQTAQLNVAQHNQALMVQAAMQPVGVGQQQMGMQQGVGQQQMGMQQGVAQQQMGMQAGVGQQQMGMQPGGLPPMVPAAVGPGSQQMGMQPQGLPPMGQTGMSAQAQLQMHQQHQHQQLLMKHQQQHMMQMQMQQQQQHLMATGRLGTLHQPLPMMGMSAMAGGYGAPAYMRQPATMQQYSYQQLLAQRQQQEALEAEQKAAEEKKEPEPEEDPEEDILAKVGKISEKLRSMLGKEVTDKGFSGTDEEAAEAAAAQAATPIVRREDLVEACGPVAGTLKSYQLVGINFLMMLHKSESVGGAILADEMGLGKTAQTITFLGVLRTLLGNRSPHLVVCPASLIQNWAREFKQWCPGLRVLIYHGKERDQSREALQRWRRRVRAAQKEGKISELPPGMLMAEEEEARDEARAEAAERQNQEDLLEEGPVEEEAEEEAGVAGSAAGGDGDGRTVGGVVLPGETSGEAAFDVMLTTYTLFEREGGYKADRAFLLKWKWGYMVADEAHALKNRSSIRTRKLRKVASSCENRILLTGTPLQNSLEELRALLEFLMPTLFVNPNHQGQQGEAKDDEMHMRKLAAEEQNARVETYKTLLAPFILRRLKSEVATQLISKKQVVQEVEMTPEQGKLYRTAVENMRREVAAATTALVATKAASQRSSARPRRATERATAADDGLEELVGSGAGGGKAGKKGSGRSRGGSAPASGGGAVAAAAANAPSPAPPTEAGTPASAPSPQIPGEVLGNVEMLVAKLGSQRVNNIFTHLRKVAQHPLLIRNLYTDEQVQKMAEIASSKGLFAGNCTYDRVFKELAGYSDHQLHIFASTYPTFLGEMALDASALMTSAKVRCLDELMPKFFAGNHKVLLFSQWTMTLDLLEWYMRLKQFSYVRLDGSTQVEDRLALVDRFNDPAQGIFCFLLSTRAGGQGLNLTGADVVVLHDVDFNPQVDRQAEDRCHRLGQTKPVSVYRLVTKGTVDQNVFAIAERKLALDAAVLNDVTIGVTGEDGDGADDAGGAGASGSTAAAEGGAAAAAPSRKRGKKKDGALDQKEVRHMGAILSALLSDA